jgi:hypothetical protein
VRENGEDTASYRSDGNTSTLRILLIEDLGQVAGASSEGRCPSEQIRSFRAQEWRMRRRRDIKGPEADSISQFHQGDALRLEVILGNFRCHAPTENESQGRQTLLLSSEIKRFG